MIAICNVLYPRENARADECSALDCLKELVNDIETGRISPPEFGLCRAPGA